MCFPDNPKWQLLHSAWSKDHFISVPYCREAFFKDKLEIVGNPNCILKTVDGLTSVTLRPKKGAKQICLTYELYLNTKESKQKLPRGVQLDRYVAIMNSERETTFDLRLPVKGIYKLVILDSNDEWVVFYKIICDLPKRKVQPFPVNTEIGFGPGLKTETSGLCADTHKNGVIIVRETQKVQVRFTLRKTVNVQTTLVHVNKSSEDLKKFVSHTIKNKELVVNVGIPNNGEYALQINSRDKGTGHEYSNVCNYLLHSVDPLKVRRKYEVNKNIHLVEICDLVCVINDH